MQIDTGNGNPFAQHDSSLNKSGSQISNLNKLTKKANKTSEYIKKLFTNTFESRRSQRQKLYDRLRPKLDQSSSKPIEEYRRKEWGKLKKLEAEQYPSIKDGRSLTESIDH